MILAESPYKKGFPYGLACNAAGRNAVEWTPVYQLLTGEQPKHVHAASAFCRLQKYEDLVEAVRQLQPKTITDAEAVLAVGGLTVLKTPSMLKLAAASASFRELLNSLWKMANTPGLGQRTAVNLLVRMRSEGWILLPKKIVQVIGPIVRGLHATSTNWEKLPEYYLNPNLIALLERLGPPKEGVKFHQEVIYAKKRRHVLLCSSVHGSEDFSVPLLRKLLGRTEDTQAGADIAVSTQLRKRWSELAVENGPDALQRQAKNDHRRSLEDRVPQDRIDELKSWIDALVVECDRFGGGMMEPLYKPFGVWMQWLCSFKQIPLPVEITREMVVGNGATKTNSFIQFLEDRGYSRTKNKNLPLSKLHKFFERLRIEEEAEGRKFLNPISLQFDLFRAPRGETAGRTDKERVPEKVMDQLKAMLVVDKGEGHFEWGPKVAELTRLKGAFGMELAQFGDDFCPILPAIVYLLLEYPLRTHQVRWLDSGELDEYLFDFASKTFVHNPGGIKGRAYGMVQPDDAERFAAIAGHKTIVMTLHYHREDVGNLRRVVRESMNKRGALAELQELDRKLEEYQNYEEYLISSKQGFAALRNAQTKGNMIMSLSGICPGTTCDKGLGDEFRATCGSDVPGSRCALCQYRVYGPPFLPGLVLELNTLLMELQSKAKHFCEQREVAKKLEDQGHDKEADLIRGELDLMDREAELDIKVLFRLDEMIWQCTEQANAARSSGKQGEVALVASDEIQKKLVSRLELGSEFDLLKSITGQAARRITQATGRTATTIEYFLRHIAKRISGASNPLIVVDEASMLDLQLTTRILRECPATARLLLVGDPAQLPPVNFGLIFHKLAESPEIPKTELTIINRQTEESGIPTISRQIRAGEVPSLPEYRGPGTGVSFISAPRSEVIQRLIDVKTDLPGAQVLCVKNAGGLGIQDINEVFHRLKSIGRDTEKSIGMSVGEPVIFKKNVAELELVNGSLGNIAGFERDDDGTLQVQCSFAEERKNIGGVYLEYLKLAYAITVHSAQGSQFDRVVILVEPSQILDRTLIYTALTRGVHQVVFIGDRNAFEHAIRSEPKATLREVVFRI